MTSVIVIGGAGKLGRAIVEEAARQGLDVTAHVRSSAKAAGLPKTVRIVQGDGLDEGSLSAAIPGHDVVIVPAGGREEPVSAKIVTNAIAAMRKSGVTRLIGVSAYGAVDPKGFYGWMLKTMAPKLAVDKQAMEAAMQNSGLEYTAVRPPVLNDGPATAKIEAVPGAVLRGMPALSRADVATFIVGEVLRPRFTHAAPVLFQPGTKTA